MSTTIAEKTDIFFCQACLKRQPISEQSADERYCEWGFHFLKGEYKRYASPGPAQPRTESVTHKARKNKSVTAEIARLQKTANNGKAKKPKAEKPTPTATIVTQPKKTPVTTPKQGKPTKRQNSTDKNVTVAKVLELSKQGLSSRDIARQIKTISHMTAARIVAGQRSLI